MSSTASSADASRRIEDLVEIQQLLARYSVRTTQGDVEGVVGVFAEGGTYSAFGDVFTLDMFPDLLRAAPSGLFMTGTSLVEFDLEDPDAATGEQPLCFVDQKTHDMRIGWYNDTYVRTADGWRLATRKMTFLRRSGAQDSGRPHAYVPTGQ